MRKSGLHVANHLVWAILVAICCRLSFGIVASDCAKE